MAPIVESIEINRRPEEVFAYLDDLGRHSEWQEQLVDVQVLSEGPTHVGTRARQTRRVPPRPQTFTFEITEHDPPRRASFRVLDGPVRPTGTISVDPVDDGSRSRVTLHFEMHGHGIGKLLLPLARMNARKQIPKDQVRLKQTLER
jgi:uncharacterized membrane protein